MTQQLYIISGSSRGMGQAMALQVLAEGHDVLGLARKTSPTLAALAHERGSFCEQWACDLGAPLSAAQSLQDWLLALDEALKPKGAKIVSLAPGVIDTDMQAQLRSAAPADFPEQARFAGLHSQGQLSSAEQAAQRVLSFLRRGDFGREVIADARQA